MVFPACAGMNRPDTDYWIGRRGVPRMRGDEPDIVGFRGMLLRVFPACAGMNRGLGYAQPPPAVFPACAGMNRRERRPAMLRGVPRMRGDEPTF